MNILHVQKILVFNHSQMIEQARFIYSTQGRTFKKQTKTIEDQGRKQVKALPTLKT